jgi:hypothetical protein
MYPLLEVDTQFEADNDGLPSVLRTLVEHKRLHHLGVRQIRSLVRDKWRRSAHIVFRLQLFVFAAVLVLLSLQVTFGSIYNDSATLYALLAATAFLGVTFLPPGRAATCAIGSGPSAFSRGSSNPWGRICPGLRKIQLRQWLLQAQSSNMLLVCLLAQRAHPTIIQPRPRVAIVGHVRFPFAVIPLAVSILHKRFHFSHLSFNSVRSFESGPAIRTICIWICCMFGKDRIAVRVWWDGCGCAEFSQAALSIPSGIGWR